MIAEVDSQNYEAIRPLVPNLMAYNVSIEALLDGNNPGRIFADDAAKPKSVFIQTVEGFFLAGDITNSVFLSAIKQHIVDTYPSHWVIHVVIESSDWEKHLATIFAPRSIVSNDRRYYVCSDLVYTDWKANLPDGFSVRRIDNGLLNDSTLEIPEHITGWATNNWGSVEAFLQSGFGFCTLHNDNKRIVSWSLADCISQTRCEIGIRTHEDYRQQGLASITAAATVDYALSNGFNSVGWHCHEDNVGSYKTAEKVGFIKERDYVDYATVPPER